MVKPSILVTRKWPKDVEICLLDHFNATLNRDDTPLSQDVLKDAFRSYDAVFPTVTDAIDREVMSGGNLRTKLIGNFGVGFNHIDVDLAKQHEIVVTNTPDVLTDATADLAMALILSIARKVGEGERLVRCGGWTGWRPTQMLGRQITGATLGIIGFGRIGQAVARRAHYGFGMPILVQSRSPIDQAVLNEFKAVQLSSLEELLGRSDFVSLHCPSTAENHHMIDLERLRLMKPEAFLINTARGTLVKERDLVVALESGLIAGAGLDVFEAEPRIPAALLGRSDAVLLPHLGSATEETRTAMGMRVLSNAIAFFAGKPPPDRVA